jgi:NlpC/P60 family putative phage cell wall peptidase
MMAQACGAEALRAAEIVAAARGWIGTPYCHGASLRGAGADCLGLVRGVWRELFGAEAEPVPPYGQDWAESACAGMLLDGLRRHLVEVRCDREGPGQVLLFRLCPGGAAKHLGIQSACGPRAAFVHSYSGYGVVESALTKPWRRRLAARFVMPTV